MSLMYSANQLSDPNSDHVNVCNSNKKKREDKDDKLLNKRQRIIRTSCNDIHDFCMNSIYKCCICMDKRIFEDLYNGYIDGIGYTKFKCRSDGYCPSCKEKLK